MLTASFTQAATYFLAVCLFSISFLVFLNASVSFVVTDLINDRRHVGEDVGTLGFADELMALIACPLWGVLSDRVGVRTVSTLGYLIVGLSLFLFVQAGNVYPQLLLARLLFSLGGSATATMVTAILPAMTAAPAGNSIATATTTEENASLHLASPSVSSGLSVTTTRSGNPADEGGEPHRSSPTSLAGFVGLFTGLGALVALGLFLPLLSQLRQPDTKAGTSIIYTYYIVAVVAILVAIACFIGLRNIKGEENKGLNHILNLQISDTQGPAANTRHSYRASILDSLRLGVAHSLIGLGYLGGFVARASSVGISLFIPLYVNAYFISSGNCKDPIGDPSEIKAACPQAYVLAAELTGTSQLVALMMAPAFGFFADRYPRHHVPLLLAALVGILGYLGLASLKSPLPSGSDGNPAVFLFVSFIGISQIGCIVCSLGLLGRGISGLENPDMHEEEAVSGRLRSDTPANQIYSPTFPNRSPNEGSFKTLVQHAAQHSAESHDTEETRSLLGQTHERPRSLNHLKGSIAGMYSFGGGAGILLLTKLGGFLFDTKSNNAPFYMLAIFNVLLFLTTGATVILQTKQALRWRQGMTKAA